MNPEPLHRPKGPWYRHLAETAAGKARDAAAPLSPETPSGCFVEREGELYYRIGAFHRMPPFLMTLASDTDLWMFVTSGGGLTAGRVDPEGSVFPYETVDKLHDSAHHTGPITIIRLFREEKAPLTWRPFDERTPDEFPVHRNLYKNFVGNKLLFEEIQPGIGLVFRYRWAACDAFGWIRTATIENIGSAAIRVELLDGLRNILPYGAHHTMFQHSSVLVDAYKKSELDPRSGLAIYSLTAGIVDRPEAAEVLRANTVWRRGLEDFRAHLSEEAFTAFRRGETLPEETVRNGHRGNYILTGFLELEPGASETWHLAVDAGRSHARIVEIRNRILRENGLGGKIEEEIGKAEENLCRNVGSADGIQLTGRAETTAHHFANVLFNNMRGGVFTRNHEIPVDDLADFFRTRNREAAGRSAAFLRSLPEGITFSDLLREAEKTGDPDVERLCHEYLPLHFGRRHGDPSRPWNQFSIRVRNRDGDRSLRYEGNWRDIFQNWEALCASFPEFLPGVIAKFVNASTVDGFNPYRITREGIDWETADPDDPWAHIGYWGDHQIIYLLKFLEAATRYSPGTLESLLERDIFSYADVPYRIRPYEEILHDPRATIDYDAALASRIEKRVRSRGADGRLLTGPDGAVHHVNLFEKLLVPLLSKLSNFVPDGGVWMNTQRPEWNDANNALVGDGLSVVTTAYLRRYVAFLEGILAGVSAETVTVSTEVAGWFRQIRGVLVRENRLLDGKGIFDGDRKRIMDGLGNAFSEYRRDVYENGFSGKRYLSVSETINLLRTARYFLDRAMRANRREDGLYHSYNLLDLSTDGREAGIRHLPVMLEGQVAALSSGLPDPTEGIEILENLFRSSLYRPDQKSFLLYPERKLPGFLEKNRVPEGAVRSIPLLRDLLDRGDGTIVARDEDGVVRFHGDFRNAEDVGKAVDSLAEGEGAAAEVARDRDRIVELFEDVFLHHSYTGRSGTMYAYEGLGCIYWHMVAKLLLAVQETYFRAERESSPEPVRDALATLYYRVRRGLGFEKSVVEYGAFPTDPYSHTPPGGGAKQPGMTGQVKEEILTRLGELGVRVEEGTVRFDPVLLRPDEFLERPAAFEYFDVQGNRGTIDLAEGSLAFTFCSVPVVYERVEGEGSVRVLFDDGSSEKFAGNRMDRESSRAFLGRRGTIREVRVRVPGSRLYRGRS
ncbi:MAG: hypothetical protein JW958_12140 [Candidatus Eisenbacteria bacterium]|nr:hypothetical protein [Candidatus Eisenbacteria bacterium]